MKVDNQKATAFLPQTTHALLHLQTETIGGAEEKETLEADNNDGVPVLTQ